MGSGWAVNWITATRARYSIRHEAPSSGRSGLYRAGVSSAPSGELLNLPIDQLLLDWNNPRLPPEERKSKATQRHLALTIEKNYDAYRIAESISRHEYFLSEPLIALREGDDRYRVIEGNRRLTALKGLSDPDLKASFAQENRAWSKLGDANVPERVPVLVVKDAASVAPLLGFRHISGIEPWEPYAQAAFIADLVNQGQTLEQVAATVGRSTTEVRSMYRDFDILRFASERQIDVRPARDAFGVFTAAMGRPAMRAYIGASDPRLVNPDYEPIGEESKENLARLLRILFGDSKGNGRILRDSRQISSLVRVFSDTTGKAIDVLFETNDLDEALAALTSEEDQLLTALAASLRSLQRASRGWTGKLPASARESLDAITDVANELRGRMS